MTTRLMTLAAILFLATVSVFAQNPDKKYDIICNVIIQDSIETKECIYKNKITGEPIQKKVYISEVGGKKLEIVVSLWEMSRGWVASRKTEYKYDDSRELNKVVNLKWDARRALWSDMKEQKALSR